MGKVSSCSGLQGEWIPYQSSGGMGLFPSHSYTFRTDNQNFPQAGATKAEPWLRRNESESESNDKRVMDRPIL